MDEEKKIARIEITFRRKWDFIRYIRNIFHLFLLRKYNDVNYCDRIVMSLSELIENSIKYSQKDKVHLIAEFKKDQVVSEIINYPKLKNFLNFKEEIETINQMDAKEAYVAAMKRVSKRSDKKKSQLGLSRIRYEGKADISFKAQNINSKTKKLNIKVTFNR